MLGRQPCFSWEQLMRDAQVLWLAKRQALPQVSRVWRVFSALVLLMAFVTALRTTQQLPTITLPELPLQFIPIVLIGIALIWLRIVQPQFFSGIRLANLQTKLPFTSASLHRRINLQIALFAVQWRSITSLVVAPRIHPDDSVTLLINCVIFNIHAYTSRVQTAKLIEAVAFRWQSIQTEARRTLQIFHHCLNAWFVDTPFVQTNPIVFWTKQTSVRLDARIETPLVVNLLC